MKELIFILQKQIFGWIVLKVSKYCLNIFYLFIFRNFNKYNENTSLVGELCKF